MPILRLSVAVVLSLLILTCAGPKEAKPMAQLSGESSPPPSPTRLNLGATNGTLQCPNHFASGLGAYNDASAFYQMVRQLNFNPVECTWDTMLNNAPEVNTIGFSYGSMAGVSIGAGGVLGRELIMIANKRRRSVQVAVMEYKGLELALGLPGVALTQSLIFGDCPKGANSYAGYFVAGEMIAMLHQKGVTWNGTATGCDALSSVRGTTSPIVGGSLTHYSVHSRIVEVTGPRVEPFLNYLDNL